MKWNVVFILCQLFFISMNLNGQYCGTIPSEDTQFHFSINDFRHLEKDVNAQLEFNIAIHFVNCYNELDELFIRNDINRVNEAFASESIEFNILCDTIFTHDLDITTFNRTSIYENVHQTVQTNNVINIYVLPDITTSTGDLCGYTFFPWNDDHFVAMNVDCLFSNTLVHEFGHFFGLYHTHETAFGVEYIARSNCEIAGDKLCDTNADPTLSFGNVNSDCLYIGNDLDPLNFPYAVTPPDATNFMSYAPSFCKSSLSDEQYFKMRFYADELVTSFSIPETELSPYFNADNCVLPSEIAFGWNNLYCADELRFELIDASNFNILYVQNIEGNEVLLNSEAIESIDNSFYCKLIVTLDGIEKENLFPIKLSLCEMSRIAQEGSATYINLSSNRNIEQIEVFDTQGRFFGLSNFDIINDYQIKLDLNQILNQKLYLLRILYSDGKTESLRWMPL